MYTDQMFTINTYQWWSIWLVSLATRCAYMVYGYMVSGYCEPGAITGVMGSCVNLSSGLCGLHISMVQANFKPSMDHTFSPIFWRFTFHQNKIPTQQTSHSYHCAVGTGISHTYILSSSLEKKWNGSSVTGGELFSVSPAETCWSPASTPNG